MDVAWDYAGYEKDGVDDAVHAWTCDDHSEEDVSLLTDTGGTSKLEKNEWVAS